MKINYNREKFSHTRRGKHNKLENLLSNLIIIFNFSCINILKKLDFNMSI